MSNLRVHYHTIYCLTKISHFQKHVQLVEIMFGSSATIYRYKFVFQNRKFNATL